MHPKLHCLLNDLLIRGLGEASSFETYFVYDVQAFLFSKMYRSINTICKNDSHPNIKCLISNRLNDDIFKSFSIGRGKNVYKLKCMWVYDYNVLTIYFAMIG